MFVGKVYSEYNGNRYSFVNDRTIVRADWTSKGWEVQLYQADWETIGRGLSENDAIAMMIQRMTCLMS